MLIAKAWVFLAQNMTGRKLLIQPKLVRNYESSARNLTKIFREIYIFV